MFCSCACQLSFDDEIVSVFELLQMLGLLQHSPVNRLAVTGFLGTVQILRNNS